MKSISERIKEGLNMRGMKQSELVEKTGIGKSSISTYISGSYEPKQRNIYKIAKALDVNEAWLMGLDVSMDRKSKITEDSHVKIREQLQLSKQDDELLRKYNSIDEKGKHTVNTVLEMEYNRCNKPHIMPIAAHNDFAEDKQEQRLIREDLDEL